LLWHIMKCNNNTPAAARIHQWAMSWDCFYMGPNADGAGGVSLQHLMLLGTCQGLLHCLPIFLVTVKRNYWGSSFHV